MLTITKAKGEKMKQPSSRLKCSYGQLLFLSIIASIFTFQCGVYSRALVIGSNEFLDQILGVVVIDGIINEDDAAEDDDSDEEIEEDPNHSFPASGLLLSAEYHNLDISYLNENKLTEAMTNLITKESYILGTLLSYHCVTQSAPRKNISCYAILSNKNHIFVHGFVEENDVATAAIAVDILSCDVNQFRLVEDVLPLIGVEFAGYNEESGNDLKNMRWKAHIRNSPEDTKGVRNVLWEDLGDAYLFRRHYLKNKVATHVSMFQRIDVWDFVIPKYTSIPSYFKSKSEDKDDALSYESLHPEYYAPERVMFLDGVSQSLRKGVEPYHEALVQPAMFAHPNPRRVAIIGGGEGATLREALKHKSVTNVTMIDIDEVMCKVSAEVLYPAWNGCDDMPGSTPSCFDNARAHVRYEDALAWFIARFSTEQGHEKYDVIIMDALDPQDTVEFANILYQDATFWQSIYNALSEDGILVAQLGNSPERNDGPDMSNKNRRRAKHIEVLKQIGFATTHSYEEGHCKFDYPWTFLLVCKSTKCNQNWYATPAQVEIAIHNRILPTTNPRSPPLIKYFDGATMAQYRVPHKGAQTVFCRTVPTPFECQLVDQFVSTIAKESSEYHDIVDPGTFIPVSLNTLVLTICEITNDCQTSISDDLSIIMNSKLISSLTKLTGPENSAQLKSILEKSSSLNPNAAVSSAPSINIESKAHNLFYSPLLDRHLPLFGYWMNHNKVV